MGEPGRDDAAESAEPEDRSTEGEGPRERRCEVCGVRLSAYNPGPNCWQHTIGFPWRGPTAKPRY